MKRIFLFFFCLTLLDYSFGQYYGGSGQGINSITVTSLSLATNSLYSGGNNDGNSSITSNAISLSALNTQFSGGNNDGCSSITSTSISLSALSNYSGGVDDGIASANATGIPLSAGGMFSGGADDGISQNSVTGLSLASPTIYSGGADDGFSLITHPSMNLSGNSMFSGGADDGLSSIASNSLGLFVNTMYSGGNDDGFSSFTTLGSIWVILPINWQSFTVVRNGKDAVLHWQVGTELSSLGYEIERSYDGIHFSKIGFEKTINNSGTKNEYYYSDADPARYCPSGICSEVFYRLRQLDIDQQHFTLSAIRKLKLSNFVSMAMVYPNPASEQLFIVTYPVNGNSLIYDLTVYNSGGAVMYQRNKLNSGKYEISIQAYPSGLYYLKLNANGLTNTYQISILH